MKEMLLTLSSGTSRTKILSFLFLENWCKDSIYFGVSKCFSNWGGKKRLIFHMDVMQLSSNLIRELSNSGGHSKTYLLAKQLLECFQKEYSQVCFPLRIWFRCYVSILMFISITHTYIQMLEIYIYIHKIYRPKGYIRYP